MTGMGRKKTEMKMSQGTDDRKVVPPRQRSGLFKRASELTTLCAVETGLVTFSPGDKAVSFAHPGAEPIITNLAPTGMPGFGSTQRTLAEEEAILQALDKKYRDLLEQLEAEKEQGGILQKRKMMNQQHYGRRLWDVPVDELNLEELLALQAIMEELDDKLRKQMAKHSAQTSAPTEGGSVDPNGHGTDPGNSFSGINQN